MAMKIKLVRSYRKPAENGRPAQPVFVYHVSGSKPELEQYAQIQGKFYREDEKANNAPLFFHPRCAPDGTELIITQNNRVVPNMAAYDQADSLSKQYGGNFGQEIARIAAEKLMAGTGRSTGTPAEEPQPAPTDSNASFEK